MKHSYLRFLAGSLAAIQMLLPLASCSESETKTNESQQSENNAAESTDVYTGLEEADLDGFEFRIMTKATSAEHCHHDESFYVEEYVGEGVNDAVYDRQLRVLERYNFTVQPITESSSEGGWADQFRQCVQANDNSFDLALHNTSNTSSVVLNGYTIPWNELENVDLEQPWWNQSALDSLSVKGTTFYTTGDLTYETIAFTYCMFFNKELAADWGISPESLYQLVDEGKWTLSKLYTLTNAIYTDTNGDGKKDYEDLYGFTTNSLSGQAIYAIGADTLTVLKDENDMPYIRTETERLASLVEKMYILMYESEGTFPVTRGYATRGGSKEWWAMTSYKLLTHSTVFTSGLFYELYHEYTEKDFEIGVLPLPKYDTAQSRYMTMADYHCPFAVVPTTANRELTGFCATALAAYGRELITPAYYETALKARYADTQRDADMIELTMEGLTYDMYTVYMDGSILQSLIYDKSFNFASYWAKNEKSVQKKFDNVMKAFNDYID